jgi:hypothetical protein
VPVKFYLTYLDGTHASTCKCTISFSKAGSSTGVVDESIYSTPADSGSLFRYDPTSQQYIYNLGTKTLTAGKYTVTVTFDDGSTPPATINFGLKA